VHYDRPIIDADMMGRAYPSMEHGILVRSNCLGLADTFSGTPYVYGHPIAPCAMADAKGNISVVMVGTQFSCETFPANVTSTQNPMLAWRRCCEQHVSSSA
jgi:DUF917 family protein